MLVGMLVVLLMVLVQGVIFHLGHVAQKFCPQGQKSFPMNAKPLLVISWGQFLGK